MKVNPPSTAATPAADKNRVRSEDAAGFPLTPKPISDRAPAEPNAIDAKVLSAVRGLLTRSDVPPRKHVSTLAAILGQSQPQAYRKVRGDVPFGLSELSKIADHFGSSLSVLLGVSTEVPGVPATWVCGERKFGCLIWMPGTLERRAGNRLVARATEHGWVVEASTRQPVVDGALRVDRLQLRPVFTVV